MDTNEPTAWEEINPTTALARQPERPTASGLTPRLEPATSEQFRNELTACLALVVPVGMDEAARSEWLAIAWATVGHLPADLLKLGCAEARKVADHPSKIVPAIIAETEEMLKRRRVNSTFEMPTAPRLEPPKGGYCTPEQAAEIMREYGLKRNPLDIAGSE